MIDNDIKKVILWLNRRGYDVYLGRGIQECVSFNGMSVFINSNNRKERRLYTLLHECGHILVNDNRDRLQQVSAYVTPDCGRSTKSERVAALAEEYDAWKRGERLANRLNINLDYEKFDKLRDHCIMSYINWAAS